jgi:hypothetical protein
MAAHIPKPTGARFVALQQNPKVAGIPFNLRKSVKAPPPKAGVAPKASSASAPAREHRDPQLIKADVKMRKVQAFTKKPAGRMALS